MDDGLLKKELESCETDPLKRIDFSIGYRGAGLQFPEHTQESYQATAKMGAGILAVRCSVPFQPAVFDNNGNLVSAVTAQCCTSDIALTEFKSLKGKMDGFDPLATTVSDFMEGTPNWRTDLYTSRGTLLTHKILKQSISQVSQV